MGRSSLRRLPERPSPIHSGPGVLPENTTMRSVTEEISSGTDFGRLTGSSLDFSVKPPDNSLCFPKNRALRTGQYALSYEFSLLVTAGYDAISDTHCLLLHNVSGPVALAGVGLTLDKTFRSRAKPASDTTV